MKKCLLIFMLSFIIISCNKSETSIEEIEETENAINEVAAPEKFSTSTSEGEAPSLFE